MANGMSNIASMLAQSGQGIGQQIGAPIQAFGEGIGGMLTKRRADQAEQEKQKETAALLERYKNDPVQLNALFQKYAIEGNDALAKVFQQATEAAVKKTTQAETRGVQGGLSAITQAAARGIPLDQLQEGMQSVISLGATQADIMSAYKTGADMRKGKEPTISQVSRGASLVSTTPEGTAKVLYTAPDAPEKTVNEGFELIKGGKYTPQSVQDATQPDGSINYAQLVPVSEPEKLGSVSSPVETRLSKVNEESTKASVSLSRNRALQNSLMQNPAKSTGIASSWRTSVLDLAGLRDAEEADKTAFLRTRNTDIINSLPPGVASDTDVRIFSQGFPSENASSEEIMAYLQAEERILAASSDMALIADRHLQEQVQSGQDASFIGFEDKRQAYGSIMNQVRQRIETRIANGEDPTLVQEEEIRLVSEVLKFKPKFYR